MTGSKQRHCEPAKQSRNLTCIWIASQARNDEFSKLVNIRLFEK